MRHPGARGRIACPAPAARATANVTYARRQVPWQKLGTANGRALADATRPRPRPGRTHPVCMRAGPVFPPLPPLLGLHGKGKGSIGMIWFWSIICGRRRDCRVHIIMYRHRAKKLCNSSSSTQAHSTAAPVAATWHSATAVRLVVQGNLAECTPPPPPARPVLLAKERNRQDHGTAHHLTHTTRIIYSSFECLIQNGSETPANSTEFTMMVCVYTQLLHRFKKNNQEGLCCVIDSSVWKHLIHFLSMSFT